MEPVKKQFPFILFVIATLLSIPLSAMKDTSPATVLKDTDRAFSARAQEIGVTAAFLEYAAEDAVIYRNGMEPIVGKEAIRTVMEKDPEATLIWEPESADIAESGDLGYSRGHFVYTLKPGLDSQPEMEPFEGYYVSIWKKQADGTWKFVFDTGIISKSPSPPLQAPPKK